MSFSRKPFLKNFQKNIFADISWLGTVNNQHKNAYTHIQSSSWVKIMSLGSNFQFNTDSLSYLFKWGWILLPYLKLQENMSNIKIILFKILVWTQRLEANSGRESILNYLATLWNLWKTCLSLSKNNNQNNSKYSLSLSKTSKNTIKAQDLITQMKINSNIFKAHCGI